jgi:hypothetical protein
LAGGGAPKMTLTATGTEARAQLSRKDGYRPKATGNHFCLKITIPAIG